MIRSYLNMETLYITSTKRKEKYMEKKVWICALIILLVIITAIISFLCGRKERKDMVAAEERKVDRRLLQEEQAHWTWYRWSDQLSVLASFPSGRA